MYTCNTHIYIYIYMSVYIYIYVCVCICVCVCVFSALILSGDTLSPRPLQKHRAFSFAVATANRHHHLTVCVSHI